MGAATRDTLNLLNGLLDIGSKPYRLRKHSPEFLSIVQYSVSYNPQADCPNWRTFIKQVFPDDAVAWGYIIPMWLLWNSRTVQKAGLLEGPPGCGKSTYMLCLQRFLGNTNVSHKQLHQLTEDRFSKVALYGKAANFRPELPGRTLRETHTFNSLVGGDTMNGERKGENSFDFEPFAKLLFACNEAPQIVDAPDAYLDRWFVVPFPNRFRGVRTGNTPEKSQSDIEAELCTPDELSGLLNRALEQLDFVKETKLTVWPESMKQAYQTFVRESVKLSDWLEANVRYTGKDEHVIWKDVLLESYNEAQRRNHRASISAKRFTQELSRVSERLAQSLRLRKDARTGKMRWGYVGWLLKMDLSRSSLTTDEAIPYQTGLMAS